MKKGLSVLVLMFLMVFCFTSRVSADDNTALLNHYYTTDITSDSATVGWNIRGTDAYTFISFKQASDPSTFLEFLVYQSGGAVQEYIFTKSGLKPNTEYLVTISNSQGQHMVHLTVKTKAKACTHGSYVDTLSTRYGKYINSTSHRITEVYVRTCATCGIKLSQYEVSKTVVHGFSPSDIRTHKCKDCGYAAIHEGDIGICSKCGSQLYRPLRRGVSMIGWTKVYRYDALQLIKEGRLYETDSKGQIYKKVQVSGTFVNAYIESTTKYSSNSVYIAMDTSNLILYKNTSSGDVITSLKPEIISQIDARIKGFQTIILSTLKAYQDGVINKSRFDQIIIDTSILNSAFTDVKKYSISSDFLKEINTKYIAAYKESGQIVQEIQQKLLNLGYTSQEVTGYYGDNTFNNVCYFQIINNLRVTGFVDSETLNRINQPWQGSEVLPNPVSVSN